jgi:predicted cobalt transporter CbtA
MRDLLVRGLLAGVLASVLAIGFAEVFGEPQIDRAISVEDRIAQQAGRAPEAPIVSRAVQRTLGLAIGVLTIGTALGGLFALAFAFAYGRLPLRSPRATALVLATAGFVAVFLVPYLKYPANPPSVGNPDTIGHRTALYFGMMALSAAAAVGAVVLAHRLVARFGGWDGTLLALGAFVAVVAVAYVAMPGVNEVPTQFPAVTLWRFRVAALGTQLVIWAGLGLIFGGLSDRRHATRRPPVAADRS